MEEYILREVHNDTVDAIKGHHEVEIAERDVIIADTNEALMNVKLAISIANKKGADTRNKRKYGRSKHFTKVLHCERDEIMKKLTMTERGFILSLLYLLEYDNYVVDNKGQRLGVKQIGKRIGCGETQTKAMIKSLEEKGILIRESSGRSTMVKLTEKYFCRT